MNRRRSSGALSEADADALLSGRPVAGCDDLHEILGLMRTASALPVPTPTAALAAVLHDGFDPLPLATAPDPSRWGRRSVRFAAMGAAAMMMTLGAATANALPASVQTGVADIVGAVTPVELPRPATAPAEDGSDVSGGPSPKPAGGAPTPATAPVGPKAPLVPPRVPAPSTGDDDDIEDSEPDTDVPEADVRDGETPEADAADSATGQRAVVVHDSARAHADEPDTNQPETAAPATSEVEPEADVPADQDDVAARD